MNVTNGCSPYLFPTTTLLGGATAIAGVFVILAAFQILPAGTNAISNLGQWGKGIGYGLAGVGSVVCMESVIGWVKQEMEAAAEAEAEADGNLVAAMTEEFVREKSDKFLTLAQKNDYEGLDNYFETDKDLRALIKTGAFRGMIHTLCEKGDLEFLKWFHKKWPQVLEQPDADGKTSMHYACQNEDKNLDLVILDLAIWLHSQSPDLINTKDACGRTPMHLACRSGNLGLVKLLHEKSPGLLEKMDQEGMTPIHYCCQSGDLGLIQWLHSKSPGLTTKLIIVV